MNKNLPHSLLLSLFSFPIYLVGQTNISFDKNVRDTIYLKNPSFEDVPRQGGSLMFTPIEGWSDCGRFYFPEESAPDILPLPGEGWGVKEKAQDGETYLGMVVRHNETWEMVSQKLRTSLQPGKCYSFHAYLNLSSIYLSRTKLSRDSLQNFSHPTVLCIWGGAEECDRTELLVEGRPINHFEWKEYAFELKPTKNIKWITLEAFYYFPDPNHVEEKWAYNGHILIDHLSPIIEVECK